LLGYLAEKMRCGKQASTMLKLVAILSILIKKGSEDIGKNLSRNEFFNIFKDVILLK